MIDPEDTDKERLTSLLVSDYNDSMYNIFIYFLFFRIKLKK